MNPAQLFRRAKVSSRLQAAVRSCVPETLESRVLLTGSLPPGFSQADIGAVTVPGTSSFASGTFTVTGSGSDVGFGSNDSGTFVSESLSQNVSIISRVASQIGRGIGASAGVGIRSDNTDTAATAFLGLRSDGQVFLNVRTHNGDAGTNVVLQSAQAVPDFLELNFAGGTVTAFDSTDGTTFHKLATATLAPPAGNVEAGYVVHAGDNTSNTAVFDNTTITNHAPPVVSIASAPDITATTSTYQFTLTYAAETGSIDATTLGDGNVTVNGPNGYNAPATLVSTGLANASSLNVTYQAAPPIGGTWDGSANGLYTVNVATNQVKDTGAVAVPAQTVGQYNVNVSNDTTPPTATIPATTLTTGGATETFTVDYADNVAVSHASIVTGNVVVTGPNSFSQTATLVSSTPSTDNASIAATYSIPAPNTTFTSADNGTYSVSEQASHAVTDTSGNQVASGTIGTFRLSIPTPATDTTPPTATLTTAAPITVAASTYTFVVTYADNVAVKESTLGNGNITVTGPNGYNQAATLVSASPSTNGTPIVATYSVNGPVGGFVNGSNGTYTVHLNGSSVTDTATTPNVAAAAALGTFTVNIPTPPPPVSTSPLTATFTSALPANVAGGDKGTAKVLITNTSGAPVTGVQTFSLYASTDGSVSGTALATITKKVNIKAGKTLALTFTFKYPTGVPEGDYALVVSTDQATSNGASTSTVHIAPPFIDLAAGVPTFPATLTPGKSAALSTLVTNNGNVTAAAAGFTVSFFASPTAGLDPGAVLLKSITRSISIKAGKSLAFKTSFKVPASLAAGNYFIVAQVDSSGVVADSNPSNNVAAGASQTTVA